MNPAPPSAPPQPALIDTNVLIYATLRRDHRYGAARDLVLGPDEVWGRRFVSVQNLAEMYPNLTGPKMTVPDEPDQASDKVAALGRLPYVTVLPVTLRTVERTLELCRKYSVRRQRYFDAQLVALMLEHDLRRLYTENTRDFSDLVMDTEIEVHNPFEDAALSPTDPFPG
ncbi:MAG: PIN domain-containing protein [Spirochaetaceae bacterium]|nr:MAG: PIN domain-containing protein [Spirochaetaceae bacterium]